MQARMMLFEKGAKGQLYTEKISQKKHILMLLPCNFSSEIGYLMVHRECFFGWL